MTIEASDWLRQFCCQNDVILGSSSQWRRKVLTQAGCRIVDALDPAIDEKAIRHPSAEELVIAISNAKADALVPRIGGRKAFLICTDQVALCDGEIREKPTSEEEARRFIRSYSEESKPVSTCSGVVVVDLSSGRRVHGTFFNHIFFKPIPPRVVDEIVTAPIVYTCCGGFSVDCPVMGAYVSHIEGGIDGVMGMPLGLLESLLRNN